MKADGLASIRASRNCIFDRNLPQGQGVEIRDILRKVIVLRLPYFSRVRRTKSDGIAKCNGASAAYNYAVRATIYDKTKKETSNEISFFVVRSTGIEDVRRFTKAFIYKAFLR